MFICASKPTEVMEMSSKEAIFSSIDSQPNPPTGAIFICDVCMSTYENKITSIEIDPIVR